MVEVAPPLNDGFDAPQEVSPLLMAFPGSVSHLMPPMSAIPEDFQSMNDRTDWNKFVSYWFFQGNPMEVWNLYARPDIDAEAAWRHLKAIMRSYEPKHEHKSAAVAWLMSRWFLALRPKEQTS